MNISKQKKTISYLSVWIKLSIDIDKPFSIEFTYSKKNIFQLRIELSKTNLMDNHGENLCKKKIKIKLSEKNKTNFDAIRELVERKNSLMKREIPLDYR